MYDFETSFQKQFREHHSVNAEYRTIRVNKAVHIQMALDSFLNDFNFDN